jgi:membrane protease YdiL (CAAX protease family)
LFRARASEVGRALLAIVAFYAAFIALAYAMEGVLRVALGSAHWWRAAGRGLVRASAGPVIGVVLAYVLLLGLTSWTLERLRLHTGRRAGLQVAVGMAWGIGLAALVLFITVLGGARLVVRPALEESYLTVALAVGVGLALAALLEELLFRGFPLVRAAEAIGPVGASVVLAVAFAVAHRGNPGLSPLGLANIGLAALLLSAVFFSAGGLPAAFGLHFGWNAGLALGADAPVSGLRFGLPALEYLPGPRVLVTGGAFGPEGGLAATIVLAAALVWWTRRGRGREVVRL